MKLNSDLGEGLDDVDALLMPHIDMANIACGGHTGDSLSIARAIQLAQKHHVQIGAHPSYPDKDNFGRHSLSISLENLFDSLCAQTETLMRVANEEGAQVHHLKAHGALYNDAWHAQNIANTIAKVAEHFHLKQVRQARPDETPSSTEYTEAFADRAYNDDGTLVPRSQAHAVHTSLELTLTQVSNLVNKGGLHAASGNWLNLHTNTLCVHSDSSEAVAAIEEIRRTVRQQQ